MSSFIKGQLVELCPFKENSSPQHAAIDGHQAKVLEVLGFGANRKAQVRLQNGARSGEFTLPLEALKPVAPPSSKQASK